MAIGAHDCTRRDSGGQAFGGGQTVKQAATLKLHVNSVGWGTKAIGASRVVAWVLVVDPGVREGIDPHALAVAMGHTRAESRAAAMPTAGESVQDIATDFGRKIGTINWHPRRMFRMYGIPCQVDLVLVVLSSLAESSESRSLVLRAPRLFRLRSGSGWTSVVGQPSALIRFAHHFPPEGHYLPRYPLDHVFFRLIQMRFRKVQAGRRPEQPAEEGMEQAARTRRAIF